MTELLMKFTVFLVAAILVVPVAKFLRLGSVLGYLVAGVIIGPYVLGFLGSADQESLQHASEFGVVMMLFLIGLELRPSFLWKLRIPILGMGGLQMLLCTAVIAGVAVLFGQRWRPAIAIGMILALSSTAIVVQILSEKNLLGTRAGRSAFSVLLFQDISVIPMLAILPMLAYFTVEKFDDGHGTPISQWLFHQPSYMRFIAILGAIGCVVIVGRFSAERLFRWIAATGIRDIFTAVALVIVVGVALLMESVGLSAALGTFLAGVMLADSEYRHEIELSIEPFKGLLLGLFFMSVGASIDFHLLINSPMKVIILVSTLIVVKFIVLFLIAKIFHHRTIQALLFACAMAQGGEFAFVLFSFAENNYILPSRITNLLTLVVTLSMLITPLMMIIYEILWQKQQKRRFNKQSSEEINTINELNDIIIAGYGRFNQIIGRLLRANGYECTILDNNPKVIETLKRFGQKVYYGDATRPDLLELAGANHAKLLIIGLRDPEQTALIVETARKHFPNLKIIARASDRISAYRLMDMQVDHFQRETFLSSLELGEKSLIELGHHPYTAHRQARIFKEHDENMLLELYHAWKEDPHLEQGQQPGEQYISKTRAMAESFVAVLRNDRLNSALTIEHDHAWESAPTETELMERAKQEQMLAELAKAEAEKAVAAALSGTQNDELSEESNITTADTLQETQG